MLNTCNFKINLPGFKETFNSQAEMDEFIENNYERIKASMNGAFVQFSKNFNKQEEAVAILKRAKAETPTEIGFNDQGDKIELGKLKEGYVGVTRDMDLIRENGRPLFTPFNREDYKNKRLAQLQEQIKNNNVEKLGDDQILEKATETVNAEIKSWDLIRTIGTEVHNLANIFFDNPAINRDELYFKLKAYLGKDKLSFDKRASDKVYDAFNKYIYDLAVRLKDSPANIQFFTEVALYDDDAKIVGILDLVAVDSKGQAHIVDFKVSNTNIEDWDRDKKNRSLLQLAYYKQLLTKNGIKTVSQSLFPINIGNFDIYTDYISDLTFDPKIVEEVAGDLITTKGDLTKYAKSRVITDEGKVISTARTGNVESTYNKFFTVPGVSEEERYKLFVDTRVLKSKEGEYIRKMDGKSEFLSKDPVKREEEIKSYMLLERLGTNDLAEDVKIRIEQFKNQLKDGKDPNAYDYRSPIKSFTRTENDRKAFKQYMIGSWEVMDLPELESHGILGFKNTEYGQVDFVILTREDFNRPEKFVKGTSLLGNYISDTDAFIAQYNIPQATAKNKLAMKILIHLNENVELFKDSTLHQIRAFNVNTEELEGVNTEDLYTSFDYLSKAHAIPNKLNDVKFTDAATLLKSAIYDIFETEAVKSENIKRYFTSLSTALEGYIPEDTTFVHSLKMLQQRFIKENPNYRNILTIDYSDDNPVTVVFGFLNKLIAEKTKYQMRYEDKDMVKWDLKNSLYLSSFNEIQQKTLRSALEPIRMAKDSMAQQFTEYNSSILRPIFEEFYKEKNANAITGDHIAKFSNLFERDSQGKIINEFRLKDPEQRTGDVTYLDPAERKFLSKFLPIMFKFMYPDGDIKDAKSQGYYFEVPLLRATTTSMIFGEGSMAGMAGGVGNALLNTWRQGMDIFNYFEEEMSEVTKAAQNIFEVYDRFNLSRSPIIRNEYVNKHNHMDFEKNLEVVISSLVFDSMRKRAFENAMPISAAILSASRLYQEGFTSKNMEVMNDYFNKYVRTVVFNDKLTEVHNQGVYKTAAAAKHVVTMLQLGLAPVSMVRELFQGQVNNLIKNWSKQFGDGGPEMEDYMKAVYFIGAEEVLGLGENRSFLFDETRTEALNHLYRFANLDTSNLPNTTVISKKGLTQLQSRWFLWFTASPDYLNRMSFFIAKMFKDGSIDAHQMVDGILKYDWKRDKRFSKYANGIKTDMTEYNNQRQLYLKFLEEFNQEADVVAENGGNKFVEGDALPRGYTSREREALKAFINYTLGPYDKEEKPLFNSLLFGMMFMQFKTWMVSKKTQWWLDLDKYSMGSYKHEEDFNGNKLYLDENNQITTTVTDSPYWVWKGKLQEGILQSFIRTYQDFKENGYNFNSVIDMYKKDPVIKANIKMATADLGVFFLISVALAGIIDWEELEKDNKMANTFLTAMVNSTSDLNILNIATAFINPPSMLPTAGYYLDNINALFQAMTGDRSVGNVLVNSTALTRNLNSLTEVFE
jgi:hypothetical protein